MAENQPLRADREAGGGSPWSAQTRAAAAGAGGQTLQEVLVAATPQPQRPAPHHSQSPDPAGSRGSQSLSPPVTEP